MNDFFSVTQINSYIKSILSHDYVLNRVCIKGEVSNCRYQTSSGHIYYTLKDAGSQLSCVMFYGARENGLKFELKDGMQVKAYGKIAVYEAGGKYQMYTESIEQDGIGNLYEQYEKLKEKLRIKGFFEQSHKKQIPKYINKLGVITAKGGAAVQDIINISTRRNPHIQIYLYNATVQGNESAASLIKGIHRMEKAKPDCIIIGRGGGSIEDLWSFNDEKLAETVYECEIPIISAVGHETDFTIIDFVSDLRAPTPSAAAELAVCDMKLVEENLVGYHSEILNILLTKVNSEKKRAEALEKRLKVSSPEGRLKNYCERVRNDKGILNRIIRQKLSVSAEHLEGIKDRPGQLMEAKLLKTGNRYEKLSGKPLQIMTDKLKDIKHRLSLDIEQLKVVSPLEKLNAGYSYVTDASGRNISSVERVTEGDKLNIRVKDGIIVSEVESKKAFSFDENKVLNN